MTVTTRRGLLAVVFASAMIKEGQNNQVAFHFPLQLVHLL